jgi:hypothetical protein
MGEIQLFISTYRMTSLVIVWPTTPRSGTAGHFLSDEASSVLSACDLNNAFQLPGDRSIMGPGSLLREAWEVIPVLVLLFVGSLIALRSGEEQPTSGPKIRQFFGNLYHLALRLMGYVAVLVALQYWIGLRPLLGW